MASGLGTAMNVATSALLTKQEEMSVISTNISNSDSTSYHRRMTTVTPIDGTSILGSGVYISEISRKYSSSLEASLRNANSTYSYADTYHEQISEVESVLGPDGTNYLSEKMMDFSSALQDVVSDPTSISNRSSLLSAADSLSNEFNSEYSNLEDLRNTIASNDSTGSGLLATQVSEVNSLLQQLAEVNKSIYSVEQNNITGQQALDLRDQRDSITKEISEYINITITEEDSGQYTLELNLDDGSTVTLVDGSIIPQPAAESLEISMVENPAGFYTPQIVLSSAPGTGLDLSSSGSIRALQDSRSYISDQMTNLYNYAQTLATQINSIQNSATGYDLDGNNNAGDLFVVSASQPASGNIVTVNSSLTARQIAVSDSANQSANGDNGQAMWEALDQANVINGESLLEYSERILSDVATEASLSEDDAVTAGYIVDMYESAVQEISSVSMDEEMVSMLEVQRAFQAASKVITTVDKLVEMVIQLV